MPLTRRTMLAAAPAAAAAPLGGSALAQTQSPAAPGQAPGFYRYKVGDIEVTAINEGGFSRPIEGFIRDVPVAQVEQALQEAFLPPKQVTIPITTLVLNQNGRLTLIDAGIGEFGPPTASNWTRNFRAAGFDPAQVERIVVSHFHGDHINGIRGKDGSAAFPNAEILVPAAEWAFWMDDARMNQAPEGMRGAFQGVRRVFGPVAKDVKQFEPGKEIAPGVTSVAAPGHTPGHTAFAIASGPARLMALSDTTNHPALFVRNPDWMAAFDMDGEQAKQTRRRLLDMAAAERMQVAFYHAPFPATGFIAKEGNGFRLVPVQWSPAI